MKGGGGDQKDKNGLGCENLFPTERLQQASAAHLPQCQTLSWPACGHWSSGPCGSGNSAEWCSCLSRGSGHTRQERDTSHWNAKSTLGALPGTVAPTAWLAPWLNWGMTGQRLPVHASPWYERAGVIRAHHEITCSLCISQNNWESSKPKHHSEWFSALYPPMGRR